ncbi:hypothetical protein I4F81_012876 [Pyropia yezoensis]|uniref:Uncharacterized protein n=1 Tax=Pyropia yezoensis TaxID=2788 RepID=A0ACC3CK48_PYRYE|nr:hypothetical protein I4F81_012876 [Neopyropia yezoensis]
MDALRGMSPPPAVRPPRRAAAEHVPPRESCRPLLCPWPWPSGAHHPRRGRRQWLPPAAGRIPQYPPRPAATVAATTVHTTHAADTVHTTLPRSPPRCPARRPAAPPGARRGPPTARAGRKRGGGKPGPAPSSHQGRPSSPRSVLTAACTPTTASGSVRGGPTTTTSSGWIGIRGGTASAGAGPPPSHATPPPHNCRNCATHCRHRRHRPWPVPVPPSGHWGARATASGRCFITAPHRWRRAGEWDPRCSPPQLPPHQTPDGAGTPAGQATRARYPCPRCHQPSRHRDEPTSIDTADRRVGEKGPGTDGGGGGEAAAAAAATPCTRRPCPRRLCSALQPSPRAARGRGGWGEAAAAPLSAAAAEPTGARTRHGVGGGGHQWQHTATAPRAVWHVRPSPPPLPPPPANEGGTPHTRRVG